MRATHAIWPNTLEPLCSTFKSGHRQVAGLVSKVTCKMCLHAIRQGWHVVVVDDRVILRGEVFPKGKT